MLTNFNGKTITYDEIGNPIKYLGDTLTWTEGRRLASLSRPYPGQPENQTIYTYEYNAAGQRTSKTKTYSINGESTTTEFIYEGDLLVGQKTSDGKGDMTFLHDDTGAYIGLIYEGAEYYYMKNVQGDIIGIVDSAGLILAIYAYTPWGQLLTIDRVTGSSYSDGDSSIGSINPIRYRGYYYDNETRLYYLNSRYYDPEVGRFLNADGYVSTGQGIIGFNMFAYCLDNPVNNVDFSGTLAGTAAVLGGIALWKLGVALLGAAAVFFAADAMAEAPSDTPRYHPPYLPPYIPEPSLPEERIETKIDSDSKAKSEEKDTTVPPHSTTIYRYGGTNPGNLTPKEKDRYTGLSFSTLPKPGAAVTTIEALNATGIVYAIQDSTTHVSVRPIGGTMDDWIKAGSDSIWTQAVKSVVIKWE